MDLQEQNEAIREFCEARNWSQFHTPKELAIGMATESGELLEIFRFKDLDDQQELLDDPARRDDIEDEIADVLFFLLRFADMYDVDLEQALDQKIQKNREKYPKEEYESSNRKYSE